MVTGKVTSTADGKPLPGVSVQVKGTQTGTVTDKQGKYKLSVPENRKVLVFSFIGYKTKEVNIGTRTEVNVKLETDARALEEVVVVGMETKHKKPQLLKEEAQSYSMVMPAPAVKFAPPVVIRDVEVADIEVLHDRNFNTEAYDAIHENSFLDVKKNPLSTFSIDVDNASYSNVRRFLNMGQRPPKDAVRIEELVNYFTYEYPQPEGKDPFSVTTELAPCPWNKGNQLLHIGLQGKNIPMENLPASNLVFLLDVSGSMDTPEKLPLVKAGFKLLVEQLRPQDKVALVVYAGAAGQVLPPTSGSEKAKIMEAIENLEAGGSTAGGEGIKLAYKIAQQHFIKEGNNRVILATDGDFNVGVSSDAEMERLIEEKRESGVFLTVLGFGMGNYKDSKMEKLADKGNGNYAYVDNLLEAKKVFVNEFGGTLFTTAKDVKLQLEFNPANVKAYRLIGYENRALRSEDFNNDKKDAGDLGSGHTVTALYELVLAKSNSTTKTDPVDDLKYQTAPATTAAAKTDEIVTLKLRYKQPDGDKSSLLQTVVRHHALIDRRPSENFNFAAAVASFGMLLRDSEHKGNATYASVLELAEGARGKDKEGYRIEFINMVKSMSLLSSGK
ncbi:vWA domain-containing protein [Botryobacter ruber]|uniref:vWA domain-containing protein n=1 Tax=Botryobacter ruber TaxID=2171629 RepID=UPI000E0A5370|nr:VWA domain-containing protein [Botryobacter ruber]